MLGGGSNPVIEGGGCNKCIFCCVMLRVTGLQSSKRTNNTFGNRTRVTEAGGARRSTPPTVRSGDFVPFSGTYN